VGLTRLPAGAAPHGTFFTNWAIEIIANDARLMVRFRAGQTLNGAQETDDIPVATAGITLGKVLGQVDYEAGGVRLTSAFRAGPHHMGAGFAEMDMFYCQIKDIHKLLQGFIMI